MFRPPERVRHLTLGLTHRVARARATDRAAHDHTLLTESDSHPTSTRLGYPTTEAPRAPPAPRPPKAQTRKGSAAFPFRRGPFARAGSTPSTAGAASHPSVEHRVGWCSRSCRRGRRELPRASSARQGAAPVPRARASASHRPSPPCERRYPLRNTADAWDRRVRHPFAMQRTSSGVFFALLSIRTFVCNDHLLKIWRPAHDSTSQLLTTHVVLRAG